jgi:hypothetical protein
VIVEERNSRDNKKKTVANPKTWKYPLAMLYSTLEII